MAGLGLDGWWDEPHYRDSRTRRERSEFIIGKLMQRDPKKFQRLLLETCEDRQRPETLTDAQWRVLLVEMGATVSEVTAVLARMLLQ